MLALANGWPNLLQSTLAWSISAESTGQIAPASKTNPTVSALSQLGLPCLATSSTDISTSQIQPAVANASLHGHIIPDVRDGKVPQRGKLPQSRSIQMELVFALRNLQQYQSCLDSIYDPESPNYGHFLDLTTLSPYLPTPGQKASVVSFLSERGFNVTNGASPLVIYMTATVGTAERTFAVNIDLYGNSESAFYASDSDPKVPQNFGSMISRISGLDNYSAVRPSIVTPCGVGTPDCPQGIQVGYTLSSLYANGYDGTGQKVAIVDAPGDPDMQAAIDTFDSQYGLPGTVLDIRYPDGKPSSYDPTWASETAMDVEAVHSVAPGAEIVLLYGLFDLMSSIDYVAANNLASIVLNSWVYVCPGSPSWCSDAQLASSLVSSVDSRLMLDSSQGLTILFASGDQGAKPDGIHVGTEFPASDPNVLAVGATNLVLSGCTGTTCAGYGSETGASISGGGYSTHFPEPIWQTSNIGSRPGRAVPDVSMLGYSPGIWVYSTSSDKCGTGGNSAGWFGCAGTSLSTPLWAGFLAVASQARGGRSFGNIAPLLYQLGNTASYSSTFHDITSGSNGYPAGIRWDPVTGWGSPIASNLATLLAQSPGTPVPIAEVGPSVVNANASSVWFVFPDYSGPYHSPAAKCGGVAAAALSDFSAGGFVLGLLSNLQNQVLDTSSSVSQVSCGNPTGASGTIVTLAGGGVNEVVNYYENVAGTSPAYYASIKGVSYFVVRTTGQRFSINAAPGSDYLLIEGFTDGQGRKVFMFYGLSWQGTLAAGQFFAAYIYPQPAQFPDSWYIYRWRDASTGTSKNSFPDPSDIYTYIGSSSGSVPALTLTSQSNAGVTYSGFAGIENDVFEASAGSVTFVLPDYDAPYHTPVAKCGGVVPAALSDYSAGGYMLSTLLNSQMEVLDSGSYLSSTGSTCGKFAGSTSTIVLTAGQAVNTAVGYYEKIETTAPVHPLSSGGQLYFVVRTTGAKYTVPPNGVGNVSPGHDLFLLETFTDVQGHHVYVTYGFSWQGTLAAATFLNTHVRSNLSEYQNSWYIYEWKDASIGTSHNSFPDAGDVYNQVATTQ